MAKSTRTARTAGARGDVMEVWQRPKQSWPALIVGVLIRWRAELCVLATLGVYVWWLSGYLDSVTSIVAAVLAPLAVALAVPHSRRFLVGRLWCVLDRHRLRSCLRKARVRTMNMDGALPFMLWARPTKTGERVWLWTRAGSSPAELEQVLDYIGPACFAREAQLSRTRSFSTLMIVDVIRRDPLEKATATQSPLSTLAGLAPASSANTTGAGNEPITAASVTPVAVPQQRQPSDGPAAQPLPPQNGSSGHGRRKQQQSQQARAAGRDEPSVIVGEEDLSDYID